ncbi:unnamed protein product [Protopolystoma xenopodis]|uniref:Uncharacterized protein n=1 Tax=Protopolystoma xenopodis TaxID=117903 RepID=A0A448X6B0_9PLAT|nr:unnamed protein product [Protopolystoma xenopodis]
MALCGHVAHLPNSPVGLHKRAMNPFAAQPEVPVGLFEVHTLLRHLARQSKVGKRLSVGRTDESRTRAGEQTSCHFR